MQAMFWLPYRSIWVAPIITWRRPAHTHVEHRPERASSPRRPCRRRADADGQRRWPTSSGLAVGDQQVGLERGPGQAGADHRDGADRAGEDLAVAAPRLGAGDDADLGSAWRRSSRPHLGLVVVLVDVEVLGLERRPTPRVPAAVAYSVWNASSRS